MKPSLRVQFALASRSPTALDLFSEIALSEGGFSLLVVLPVMIAFFLNASRPPI